VFVSSPPDPPPPRREIAPGGERRAGNLVILARGIARGLHPELRYLWIEVRKNVRAFVFLLICLFWSGGLPAADYEGDLDAWGPVLVTPCGETGRRLPRRCFRRRRVGCPLANTFGVSSRK
jgi:hypothetical protein